MFIGKNSFEAASFILIVQHNDRNHAQGLFARMALRHFALQILQKTIREMIQRTLAPGIFLVPRAAVRTDEFHRVLLRIAVQSGPAGAAHTYGFGITPVHGGQPPRDPRPLGIRCTSLTFGYGSCNIFITMRLLTLSGAKRRPCEAAKAVLDGSTGNLCQRLVSNRVRTRATSHPCEGGGGLLEI